jgi:hypothetical protein
MRHFSERKQVLAPEILISRFYQITPMHAGLECWLVFSVNSKKKVASEG